MQNPYPVDRHGGTCSGAAGTSYDKAWVLKLDNGRFKAKAFIWMYGIHNGCQQDQSEAPHLPTCTPFTCDGQTVEGEGATEAEALRLMNEAAKKVAETLWD